MIQEHTGIRNIELLGAAVITSSVAPLKAGLRMLLISVCGLLGHVAEGTAAWEVRTDAVMDDSVHISRCLSVDISIVPPTSRRLLGLGVTYAKIGPGSFGYQVSVGYWSMPVPDIYPWSIQLCGLVGMYKSQGATTMGVAAGLSVDSYKREVFGGERAIIPLAEISASTLLFPQLGLRCAVQSLLPVFSQAGWPRWLTIKTSLQYVL